MLRALRAAQVKKECNHVLAGVLVGEMQRHECANAGYHCALHTVAEALLGCYQGVATMAATSSGS